jgi:hypothetical protein
MSLCVLFLFLLLWPVPAQSAAAGYPAVSALPQCQENLALRNALIHFAAASNTLLPSKKRWLVYSCNCRVDQHGHATENGLHACLPQFQSASQNTDYTTATRPGCSCGGLGDRYNGVVSGLILAMLTGRAFAIDWASPCSLREHLPTHLIRWDERRSWQRLEQNLGKEEDGEQMTVNTGCLSLVDYPPEALFFSQQNITHIIQNHRVVRLLTNVNMLQPLSVSEVHGDQMRQMGLSGESVLTRNFACLFAFLFGGDKQHTTSAVGSEITRLLGPPATRGEKPILGLQIRLGGVWDTALMEVANDAAAWLSAVEVALRAPRMKAAQIFITSDRESEIVSLLRRRYGHDRILHNDLPFEENIHLDHVDDRGEGATGCGPRSAITKAFVDHHILTHYCDVLIISMSGYGATAVWRAKHNQTFVVQAAVPVQGGPLPRYNWEFDSQNRVSMGDDGRRVISSEKESE